MSELDLNFGGTQASTGFTPIPEGTYDAIIFGIEVKETKPKEGVPQKTSDGSQAKYLNVQYKITDDKEDGKYQGRFVWGIHSIRFPANPADDTEDEKKTRSIFLGWLNTVTGTDYADQQTSLNLKHLYGAEVRVVVTHKIHDNQPKENLKKVLPREEGDNIDELRRAL